MNTEMILSCTLKCSLNKAMVHKNLVLHSKSASTVAAQQCWLLQQRSQGLHLNKLLLHLGKQQWYLTGQGCLTQERNKFNKMCSVVTSALLSFCETRWTIGAYYTCTSLHLYVLKAGVEACRQTLSSVPFCVRETLFLFCVALIKNMVKRVFFFFASCHVPLATFTFFQLLYVGCLSCML